MIKPDKHGELGAGGGRCRKPDVEVETVFARLGVAKKDVAEDIGLQAGGAEFVGASHTGPRLDRLRSFPAPVSNGRSGKGNAFEHAHRLVGIGCTLQLAGIDGDFVSRICGGHRKGRQR
jgi:hypothetical protein